MTDLSVNPPNTHFDQQGQTVHGPQTNVAGDLIVQRLDPADARNQRNHAALRHMVRTFWIDGVLKHSLYNEILLDLQMQDQSDLVDNRPWDLILQRPDLPDKPPPAGAPIIDLFNQMGQRLLILGEPGSGKTTLLLELATALLDRATNDPTHPTPVVFNLSSWANHLTLAEWMVAELSKKYNIPKHLAQAWITKDELLFLLDGLDEVQEVYRAGCTEAINAFWQEHMVPLAVCCRQDEYQQLQKHLKLQGAVLLQPLREEQVDRYLQQFGDSMNPLRLLIQQDEELRKLSTSPLDLSIMVLAYTGDNTYSFSPGQDRDSQREWLFNAYLHRLFKHRGSNHLYLPSKVLHWLQWLARYMTAQGTSRFFLEQLQPTQLTHRRDYLLYHSLVRIVSVLLFLIVCVAVGTLAGAVSPLSTMLTGLQIGLRFGLLITSGILLSSLLDHWLPSPVAVIGTVTLLIVALRLILDPQLSYALVDAMLFGLPGALAGLTLSGKQPIRPIDRVTWSKVRSGLALGLLATGVLILAIAEVTSWQSGLTFGLLVGVCCLLPLFMFLRGKNQEIKTSVSPNQGIHNSRYSATVVFAIIGLIGLLIGITWGILDPDEIWITGLAFGIALAAPLGLVAACAAGGAVCIQHYLLRCTLASQGAIPWHYQRFLNYATDHLFLRRVGGEYFFYHRLLLEHLTHTQETNNGNGSQQPSIL